ncbi:hypothetical protein LCGC14_1909850 [marine sediment metagenome]|uniref:Uncharacterized protein n=1 Tax=marine sediment metagenome TaxID=412755 RepID=A0A0F9I7X5_9ZZZZ
MSQIPGVPGAAGAPPPGPPPAGGPPAGPLPPGGSAKYIVVQQGDLFRIVDAQTQELATGPDGAPLDNGGFATEQEATAQIAQMGPSGLPPEELPPELVV